MTTFKQHLIYFALSFGSTFPVFKALDGGFVAISACVVINLVIIEIVKKYWPEKPNADSK